MARKLVTMYGMSDTLGPVVLGENHENVFLGREIGEQRNYSEEVASKIDVEVRRIMQEALVRATEVLTQHRTYLDTIADRLVKEETLEQDAFADIVKDIIPENKKQAPEFEVEPAEIGE
jgi:cell division protease FtsH